MQKIVICGSMDFYPTMAKLAEDLEAQGWSVAIPAGEEHKIDYQAVTDQQLGQIKGEFIAAHLELIRQADAVLIANYPKHGISGYVGPNTLMEAGFAFALGKRLLVLNEIGQQPCRPELLGLQPECLAGELEPIAVPGPT